jgi:hypothetical protein
MAQDKAPSRDEFRVSIEGVKLPKDATDRIARAVQKAVLAEIAGIDLRAGGLGIRFAGNGGTQGIDIIAMAEFKRP